MARVLSNIVPHALHLAEVYPQRVQFDPLPLMMFIHFLAMYMGLNTPRIQIAAIYQNGPHC